MDLGMNTDIVSISNLVTSIHWTKDVLLGVSRSLLDDSGEMLSV